MPLFVFLETRSVPVSADSAKGGGTGRKRGGEDGDEEGVDEEDEEKGFGGGSHHQSVSFLRIAKLMEAAWPRTAVPSSRCRR